MADTAPAPTRSTAPAPDTTRKVLAEGVGTFVLVFFAVGAAVFGIQTIGKLGEAVTYWIAQVIGGIVAAALLKLMVSGFGGATDETGALGTNEYGKTVSLGGAMVVEVVMTCLLVLVVLLVTSRAAAPGFAGLAIGLVLTVIHLVGIPLDGTSVNPARSIGPALFNGGTPLTQLWVFIVAPLIGGALAALAAPFFETR